MNVQRLPLNNQQLTTEYMAAYTARFKGTKQEWKPDDLVTIAFGDIVTFVHDARQFDAMLITDSQYPDLMNLVQNGLDDETLTEAFLPNYTRKYESMAGHSMRRRILLDSSDLVELHFKDLVVMVGKARDFGEKHVANQLTEFYLRSVGFLPVVINAAKIINGQISPDNIAGWTSA